MRGKERFSAPGKESRHGSCALALGAFRGSHTRSLAGGSPRIHAGKGALQRSGERISTWIMRFSAGAFPGSHPRSLAGGSPRIHAGEGALQRSGERISTWIMRFSAGGFSRFSHTLFSRSVNRRSTSRSGSIYRFFFFSARYSLITWSIWRGVSLLVPLRFDSSPMIRSTSGSGAASFT